LLLNQETNPLKTSFNQQIQFRNRRFGHIYPSAQQYYGFLYDSEIAPESDFSVASELESQWKSFVTPAILPLKNDIAFHEQMLKHAHEEFWHVAVPRLEFDAQQSEEQSEQIEENAVRNLLIELVLQRLTQDFQLMPFPAQQLGSIVYVLNTHSYIHHIKYIKSDPNITITRFIQSSLANKEMLVKQHEDLHQLKSNRLANQRRMRKMSNSASASATNLYAIGNAAAKKSVSIKNNPRLSTVTQKSSLTLAGGLRSSASSPFLKPAALQLQVNQIIFEQQKEQQQQKDSNNNSRKRKRRKRENKNNRRNRMRRGEKKSNTLLPKKKKLVKNVSAEKQRSSYDVE